MSRPEIEKQILEDFYSVCPRGSHASLSELVSGIAYAVALAIDSDTRKHLEAGVSAKQHNALVEAFKVLGNQVAEHNAALQAMAVTQTKAEDPVWQCYCGTFNGSPRCYVCSRLRP